MLGVVGTDWHRHSARCGWEKGQQNGLRQNLMVKDRQGRMDECTNAHMYIYLYTELHI